MDYFQGVVAEYLRANRATFVNPEFLLQLDEIQKMPTKGTSWYVDLLAVNFRKQAVYLCEVTYSTTLEALMGRLAGWSTHWPQVLAALHRDAALPQDWPVQPWIVIPDLKRCGNEWMKHALLFPPPFTGEVPSEARRRGDCALKFPPLSTAHFVRVSHLPRKRGRKEAMLP